MWRSVNAVPAGREGNRAITRCKVRRTHRVKSGLIFDRSEYRVPPLSVTLVSFTPTQRKCSAVPPAIACHWKNDPVGSAGVRGRRREKGNLLVLISDPYFLTNTLNFTQKEPGPTPTSHPRQLMTRLCGVDGYSLLADENPKHHQFQFAN